MLTSLRSYTTASDCCDGLVDSANYATDITDVADAEEVLAENEEFLSALRQGTSEGAIEEDIQSGKRHLQAKIFKTMMSIDRERALLATNAWATFIEHGAGCGHDTRFRTLDEYLHYRSTDVGYM
jgi:ophiobolin F synthase